MPIRQKSYPVKFTARGLVDSFDATEKFSGACTQLSDLIFDQSNPEFMVSRPGVTLITNFPAFLMPGVISVHETIGTRTYGMIATGRNNGCDEPFIYDHLAGAFVAVSGVLFSNVPTSQPTTGEWTPPVIDQVGVYVIVTHPGFFGTTNLFGWFDTTNPAAPSWNAGDTATNGLPSSAGSVPTSVSNFNNRAYFACGNSIAWTDVLTLTRTASTQALTVGDGGLITTLSGMPIQTTSSGVIGSLMVFKASQIWQVTGDSALNTLSLNFLSLNFGSESPRSVVPAPFGLYFATFGGPMIVDNLGTVRSVTHGQETEPDVHAPWENTTISTRICAAYCTTIYRTCITTIINGNNIKGDYWFDEHRRRWTGPHSFTYDCASQNGDWFVLSSNDNPAALYQSITDVETTTIYNDNGVSYIPTMVTSTFPKTGTMTVKQVVESTMEFASNQSVGNYQITALDDLGNTLNNCQITIGPTGALWGSAVWGAFNWSSGVNRATVYTVPWSVPLVFKKMALSIQGVASAELSLGTFYARYQEAGYTNVR